MSVCVKGIGGPDQKKFYDFDAVSNCPSVFSFDKRCQLKFAFCSMVIRRSLPVLMEILKQMYSKILSI
jgi:hypothetical protein